MAILTSTIFREEKIGKIINKTSKKLKKVVNNNWNQFMRKEIGFFIVTYLIKIVILFGTTQKMVGGY